MYQRRFWIVVCEQIIDGRKLFGDADRLTQRLIQHQQLDRLYYWKVLILDALLDAACLLVVSLPTGKASSDKYPYLILTIRSWCGTVTTASHI